MQVSGAASARARAGSLNRLVEDRIAVSGALNTRAAAKACRDVTHPTTVKGALRKAGIALALAPEPVTTVAGIAMVGASFAIAGKEPASIATLREESTRTLSGIKGLSADLELLSLG